MPDILPVSLQNFLHCWKPELRTYKIIYDNAAAFTAGTPAISTFTFLHFYSFTIEEIYVSSGFLRQSLLIVCA